MKTMLTLILLGLMCITSKAKARAGTEGGGGGDQIVADFVSVAQTLIAQDILSDDDKQILVAALARSKIVTTDVLVNPATQEAIPNQKTLIAWGSPGYIQIKRASPDFEDLSWASMRRDGQIVSQYVFHELDRASGILGPDGLSRDDNFRLSIGKYHLDRISVNTQASESMRTCNSQAVAAVLAMTSVNHSVNESVVVLSASAGGKIIEVQAQEMGTGQDVYEVRLTKAPECAVISIRSKTTPTKRP